MAPSFFVMYTNQFLDTDYFRSIYSLYVMATVR